jgi:hypothetical protein
MWKQPNPIYSKEHLKLAKKWWNGLSIETRAHYRRNRRVGSIEAVCRLWLSTAATQEQANKALTKENK